MKTLLISLFDSTMVRNIMRTDVLRVLESNPELERIVILAHPGRVADYRKEFVHPKLVFDAYPEEQPSWMELIGWFLTRHIIHTNNVRAKIDELLDRGSSNKLKSFFEYVFALAIFYSSMVPPVEWCIRRLVISWYNEHKFDQIMQTYQPDFVFLPTIFGNNDIRLLKYCTEHKVPSVGMIKSWDNLLGKDAMLIWPDRLIVHNELVKGYAMSMHGFPEERIYISGIPQFDAYADPTVVPSREEFFAAHGLDPHKKLITYACMGNWIVLHEAETVRALARLINESNELAEPAQLLVRMHPIYIKDYDQLANIPGITLVKPGVPGMVDSNRKFDFEFREDDLEDLVGTMRWSDVVLNSGSTTTIDAVCFDTPIINIAFDGEFTHDIPARSAERLLKKDHYAPILRSGGVRVAHTREELVGAINAYMGDRSLDHEGRARIVQEQCYKLDGNSGKRIGDYINEYIQDHVCSSCLGS